MKLSNMTMDGFLLSEQERFIGLKYRNQNETIYAITLKFRRK